MDCCKDEKMENPPITMSEFMFVLLAPSSVPLLLLGFYALKMCLG